VRSGCRDDLLRRGDLAVRNFIPRQTSFTIEKNSLLKICDVWAARSQHDLTILIDEVRTVRRCAIGERETALAMTPQQVFCPRERLPDRGHVIFLNLHPSRRGLSIAVFSRPVRSLFLNEQHGSRG
jgi:hypothetical protein